MEPEELLQQEEALGNNDPMVSEEGAAEMGEEGVDISRFFEGPIPGENYTSDTRNYAWHRPPEYTDLNKAIEAAAKRLTSEEGSMGLLTLIENGMPVAGLAQAFLMSGVGAGKWTLDYALLMAGPVTHIMCLLANADGIEYDLGIDEKIYPTKALFEAYKEVDKKDAKEAGEKVAEGLEKTRSGFVDMVGTKTPKGEDY